MKSKNWKLLAVFLSMASTMEHFDPADASARALRRALQKKSSKSKK